MTNRQLHTRTNLETLVGKVLDEAGVRYIEQFPSRFGFIVDFAMFTSDGRRLAIEADGPYHSKKRDKFRDHLLRKEGWHIVRINYRMDKNTMLDVIRNTVSYTEYEKLGT